MKKSLLIVIFGAIFTNAQITYLSTDFAETGTTQNTVALTNNLNLYNFTQTGANFNWNYSSLSNSASDTTSFTDPNLTGYKSLWCLYHSYYINCDSQFGANFNLAQKLPDNYDFGGNTITNGYAHYLKTSTQLQLKMIAGQTTLNGSSIPFFIEYTQPDVIYNFPMAYGNSNVNANGINMNLANLGYNIQINSTGSRTNIVEGWGSLAIPGQIFSSVLKLKSVLDQNVTITNNGVPSSQVIHQVSYQWFAKNYKIPVLMVTGTEDNGAFVASSANFLYFPTLGTKEITVKDQLIIYPNPVKDILTTSLPEKEIQSVVIYDISGKISGNSLNVSKLPKENYIIKIKTMKKEYTGKFIKN